MLGDIRLPNARGEDDYARRVLRAIDKRRVGAATLVTLLLSLGPLSSSSLLDFFSPAEIALMWLEHLAELVVLAATLTIAYTLLDEAMWRQPTRIRLAIACAMLFALSAVLTVLLYGYYAHGFDHLPSLLRLMADSLRFGFPAIFLVLIADAHRRALQVDSAARTAEISRVELGHDEAEQQLALLQAQIEPHFLFNVLGNVRRLYRTQPRAGSETIGSLMRYLRAALPQLLVIGDGEPVGVDGRNAAESCVDPARATGGAGLRHHAGHLPGVAGAQADVARHAGGERNQARSGTDRRRQRLRACTLSRQRLAHRRA